MAFGSQKQGGFSSSKKKAAPVPTKSPVEEVKAEQAGFVSALKDKDLAEKARREFFTDSGFWLCVVFPDRKSRDTWAEKKGVTAYHGQYVDGRKLAKKDGIELEYEHREFAPRLSKRWADLAEEMPEQNEHEGEEP